MHNGRWRTYARLGATVHLVTRSSTATVIFISRAGPDDDTVEMLSRAS
jgi:hypothetical protein